MKILLDSCVWGGARAVLEAAGHDVDSTAAWAGDPGDTLVLERAHAERRVLITLDRDFGFLALVRGQPHSGIVRLVDLAARAQGPAAMDALARYELELAVGAIVTVEPGRIRIRPG